LLTTVGVGLLGAMVRVSRATVGSATDSSYESARRLLSQLRTVARRLSSGLDSVTLASDLLRTVQQHLDDTHAAVFTRTDSGVLAPLGYRGHRARDLLQPDGSLVERCWHEMEPLQETQAAGAANRRQRIVLPLRVGSRLIGVVVSEAGTPATPNSLNALMREVDEHALRLDAALTFDEIRSIATIQERHRLAREIHDGIAQEIASLGYVVDDLAATAASDGQRRKLHELRGELSRVVSELRLSIFDLRTEVSAGLGSALSDYVREVGARSGMTVHTTLDVAPTRLRSEVETELFRIAQEAITNARKHSAAQNLWVDCRIRPPLGTITVRDDGNGLGKARDDSFGIKVMRERAERINATLEISSGTGSSRSSGTLVTVTVGAEASARTAAIQTEGA
jgi:signal transduction histidine kinase